MIHGIGSDIVAIGRMRRLLDKYGDAFAQRILAPEEFAEFQAHARPESMLAKRFAAKEAFAKAIGTGLRAPVTLKNIRIGHDKLGKPCLEFAPSLLELVQKRGISRHHLSLSDEKELACAFVVLEQ